MTRAFLAPGRDGRGNVKPATQTTCGLTPWPQLWHHRLASRGDGARRAVPDSDREGVAGEQADNPPLWLYRITPVQRSVAAVRGDLNIAVNNAAQNPAQYLHARVTS